MYRWVEHTSELELEIEAADEHEVFRDGMRALAELLEPQEDAAPAAGGGEHDARTRAAGDQEGSPTPPVGRLQRRTVEATARDRPALLAAWLEELLFLAESSGLIPVEMEQVALDSQRIAATVAGRTGWPRPLVKAVTYHNLAFERTKQGYRGRVVFDV